MKEQKINKIRNYIAAPTTWLSVQRDNASFLLLSHEHKYHITYNNMYNIVIAKNTSIWISFFSSKIINFLSGYRPLHKYQLYRKIIIIQ